MAVAGIRHRHAEEEGESVFVSMTDLTVSFLFILLVLLAFFATQIQSEEMVPLSEHEALELELSEAHAAIIRLEEALANERRRTDRLERENRVLVDRLAEANRTSTELRARIEALRAELADATATINDLSAQIVLLQRDLERMRTERDDARAEVEQLSAEVDRLLAEVEQLARALDACRRNLDRLRMQLTEMRDPDSLAAYVEEGFVARERLLERLARLIRQSIPGIRVTVDTIDGVIRFRADKLFDPGKWRIREGSLAEQVAHAVGDALAETLPCYTLSPSLDIDVSCEGAIAAIETIQIEGHTDDVRLSLELREREKMLDNYDLSARRGAETLRVMTRDRPELHEYLNLRGQPVLSFAGYGATRPINQEDTDEARDQNRRIDIRFILQTPRDLIEVEQIRSQLTRRRANLPAVLDETRPWTSLSARLRKGSPLVRRSMPEEPVAVQRAAASIARSWPHLEVEPVETDPKRLVREADHRRQSGDWSDFYWADMDRAARALIDSGLWRHARYADLLRFLLDQVRPGVNRPYLRTLFRKYIETFEPGSKLTRSLAPVLKVHWREATLPVEALVTQFRIFDSDPSPAYVIAAFMAGQNDPFAAVRRLGVEAPHGPGLMASVHPFFVSSLAPRIAEGEPAATHRLIAWLKPPGEDEPLQGAGAAQAIDALLEPWDGRAPDSELQHLLEARLLAAYGDPRIRSTGVWSLISAGARRVILQWLAGATIEVFFEIVTRADRSHMWSDRKRLWMDLFDDGLITQAWFALSGAGISVAERLRRQHDEIPLAFGRNRSRSSQDRAKCLLIMNVQERWVVEGSHSFPTWVFPPGDSDALVPYEDSYTCNQFRYIKGPKRPERIVHLGDWRNKVLTALRR